MRGLPAQTNFANPTPTTRRSARSDTPERRAYPAQFSMVYCSGMDQPTKDAFAKLTTTVERQSDALASLSETVGALSKTVERGFSALAEDIAAVRREMATKGELAELRTEMREGFASIRAELRDIRQRLETLEEAARNSAGLTKEIDHLMERVRAIEKHLGIETKIAA